jgi:hypothetical protein
MNLHLFLVLCAWENKVLDFLFFLFEGASQLLKFSIVRFGEYLRIGKLVVDVNVIYFKD